jgi:hypothetical protein
MTPRRLLERLAYKYTHPDSKGTNRNGIKSMLRLNTSTGGTELCPLSLVAYDELRTKLPKLVLAALDTPATAAEQRHSLAFADWKLRCVKHSRRLLSIADLWDADDPYDLAETAVAAFATQVPPRAFVESAFAEDLARNEYDSQQASQAIEESMSEEE